MTFSEETPLAALLETHPDLSAYLEWRGVDVEDDWELSETLGAVCEQWDLDWEELLEELSVWLREEDEPRLVEWNEPLESGEE